MLSPPSPPWSGCHVPPALLCALCFPTFIRISPTLPAGLGARCSGPGCGDGRGLAWSRQEAARDGSQGRKTKRTKKAMCEGLHHNHGAGAGTQTPAPARGCGPHQKDVGSAGSTVTHTAIAHHQACPALPDAPEIQRSDSLELQHQPCRTAEHSVSIWTS